MTNKVRGWVERWKARRTKKRGLPASAKELREFVYLDEVSVVSLYASVLGMLPDEAVERDLREQQAAASGGVKGDLLVASGHLDAQVSSRYERSTQIVRKSIIQSTFKQLHGEIREFLILPAANTEALEKPQGLEVAEIATSADGRWIVEPRSLVRGALFEMKVSLDAEAVFRLHSMMSSMLDITKKYPALANSPELKEVLPINEMIREMLVGLVPIRATSADYVVVATHGGDLIVHRDIVEGLPESVRVFPLQVVGVAEQSLFWKDTRRLLFSRHEYSVLARIGRPGLQPSWTPIKLLEGVDEMLPEVGEGFARFNKDVERFARGLHTKNEAASMPDAKGALSTYARNLAKTYGLEADQVSMPRLEAEGLLVAADELDAESLIENWRAAFEPITRHVEHLLGKQVDKEVASQLRHDAREALGGSGYTRRIQHASVDAPSDKEDERLLDVEFIAMYW